MSTKQVSVCRDTRKEEQYSLDHLFKNCYVDVYTGRYHCKKCHNRVHVDLSRNYAFCPVHGML